jgi:hypothetical protein
MRAPLAELQRGSLGEQLAAALEVPASGGAKSQDLASLMPPSRSIGPTPPARRVGPAGQNASGVSLEARTGAAHRGWPPGRPT